MNLGLWPVALARMASFRPVARERPILQVLVDSDLLGRLTVFARAADGDYVLCATYHSLRVDDRSQLVGS